MGEFLRETADIETSSEGYAARFSGAIGAWILEVQSQTVLELLGGVGKVGALLEVGGGHGQLVGPLLAAGYDVTVVGSAPECRKRLRLYEETGRCHFVVSDVLALPFYDQAFEGVLCIRLLTHCERWQALIRELCRVARHSVVVEFPLHEGVHRVAPLFFGAKKRLEGNTRRWRPFRLFEITATFEAAGFACDRTIRQFFWPLVLHRMLGNRRLSERLEGTARRFGWTERVGSPAISRMIRKRG